MNHRNWTEKVQFWWLERVVCFFCSLFFIFFFFRKNSFPQNRTELWFFFSFFSVFWNQPFPSRKKMWHETTIAHEGRFLNSLRRVVFLCLNSRDASHGHGHTSQCHSHCVACVSHVNIHITGTTPWPLWENRPGTRCFFKSFTICVTYHWGGTHAT